MVHIFISYSKHSGEYILSRANAYGDRHAV